MEITTKSIFVCIAGAPNVGKSSLLNAILGQKISITSAKPQTTRTAVLGIRTEGDTQIVFTDTPGLLIPRNALDRHMVQSVNSAATDNDLVLLVVEAGKRPKQAEKAIIRTLSERNVPAILVINKIDALASKGALIPQMEEYSKLYAFKEIFPVSATSGSGVAELVKIIAELAEPSPFMYDADEITDQPERMMVAEYIREQILRQMYQEIPHGIAVVTERFERDENGVSADAVVYCEKDSHKGMIIGKDGSRLRSIRLAAQKELKRFFGESFTLDIWIKVKGDWRDNEFLIKNFGLSQQD